MKHCDTLIFARWSVPVAPSSTVLEDHAVAVTDGRISALLPAAEARETYQASVLIERPSHVLIPGLINAHTHAAMSLMRGLSDDLPLEAWLRDGIWPVEKRWASAEMVRDGTELAIAEMLRGGITCFSDQYFFPEVAAATAVDLHMRAMIGTPIIDFPTAWATSAEEYLGKGTDLVHDPYADHPLISTCFVPHSTYTVSEPAFRQLRMLADQLDRRIQIHLHETATEVNDSLRDHGQRPYDRLKELGLVNSSLLAVHAVHMSDDEIADMAEAGVSVAHCPKSNLKLASGIAPVARFRDAGIQVGIGTDSAASNNTLDMISEMRTAALLGKVAADNAAAVSAEHALEMATLGSARVLGLDKETGSIESGKWADLACIDLDALHSQPVFDPVSQLVYTARAEQVSDVWVGGRHQLENGDLTHINLDDLFGRCDEWRQRFMQQAS